LSTWAPPFPSHEFPSLKELCFDAIKELEPDALSSQNRGLGPGAEPLPVEARYQHEFYRACSKLLYYPFILSEWSGKGESRRVDFLIKSQKWAIECSRDGDRLEERISRFQKGGRYYDWIKAQEIKEYILLDFRQTEPTEIRCMALSILFLGLHAD